MYNSCYTVIAIISIYNSCYTVIAIISMYNSCYTVIAIISMYNSCYTVTAIIPSTMHMSALTRKDFEDGKAALIIFCNCVVNSFNCPHNRYNGLTKLHSHLLQQPHIS